VTGLAEVCAELRRWLPEAAALLTEPDADGTTGTGQPGSSPPWNSSAANAKFDADALIRDTRSLFMMIVTGHLPEPVSWSDGSTMAALDAIERFGSVLPRDRVQRAARELNGAVTAILQLAAVDEAERPQVITATCPYCPPQMPRGRLRLYPRSGRVACMRKGLCFDANGDHPIGLMGISQLDGSACIQWADGLVT
jgi:hypothetical protein